jgi:alpha-amylase/alpha-mannosidase (GH57 family)
MRYLCVHSHCYQPPREDPWIDEIDAEDSAWPYHDWNERIAAECYTPNSAARILDCHQRIVKIVNNYSHTSFDFGPTLLSWMERRAPGTYERIRSADAESRARFSGHGSAMAHAYNHMILPLACSRDKVTQVYWGIQDFVHRFGRQPEGMWLPETAVDLESLEILAAHGITFTLLAPRQARAIRMIDSGEWESVDGGRIDPTQAYLLRLPSGRSINLFFFDGPVSQAVSFEGLLDNGEKFIARLLGSYSSERRRAELVHIVTDGEVYGHHHARGEMALAYTLDQIASRGLARITNYGEYLDIHPPMYEVQLNESTAWSCAHGVDRWRGHCGCNMGREGWNQEWRAHLREAFDWLRDTVAILYERRAGELVKSPWAARNDYIHVVLDRSPESRARFAQRQFRVPGMHQEKALWQLLELQRHAMLMYTSCGWFFDELSGIETLQVIRHAARVVEFARMLFGEDVEPQFLRKLALAKSNISAQRDGARIYERLARQPFPIDLDVPFAKEEYARCKGLSLLHDAIRGNLEFGGKAQWPRPRLEEEKSIFEGIIEARQMEAELAYGRHGEDTSALTQLLRDLKIPLQRTSPSTAERALNSLLMRAFTDEELDQEHLRGLVEETNALGVRLNGGTLECIRKKIEHLASRCSAAPYNIEFLADLTAYVDPLWSLRVPETLGPAQNMCYALLQSVYPEMKRRAKEEDGSCEAWVRQFSILADRLALRIPEPPKNKDDRTGPCDEERVQ